MAFEDEFASCSLRHADGLTPGNCVMCGKPLPRKKDGTVHATRRFCTTKCRWFCYRNHRWNLARKAALKRDGGRCTTDGCESTERVEVNHIVPLVGRGYHAGCVHHADNLSTKCLTHHREITREQIAKRKNET